MKYIKKFSKESDRERYIKNNFVSPHCFMNSQNKSLHTLKTYQRVEYLESNGTQWIDTKYIPTGEDIRIEGKFLLKSYIDSWSCWFEAYTDEYSEGYRIIEYNNDYNNICFNCGSKTNCSEVTNILINTIYNYKLTIDKLILNDNIIMHNRKELTNIQNTGNLCLFSTTNGKRRSIGQHYYFKVFKNNNIVLNMIPIRIGTVGYMFDTVSNTLFGNNGTGNFILGPDI